MGRCAQALGVAAWCVRALKRVCLSKPSCDQGSSDPFACWAVKERAPWTTNESPSAEKQPFWTRGRSALLLGALALVVLIAVVGYSMLGAPDDSPEEALIGIASAAMQGDADTVVASLDTTALVDSAVDDVLSETDERRAALVARYLATHPDATKERIKDKARALLDEEVREHVESGTLPKRIPLGNKSLKELAAKAYARGSVRSVRVTGDVAHVVVSVPFRGKTLRVQLRMKRSDGRWRVDQVENLSDVLKQAGY